MKARLELFFDVVTYPSIMLAFALLSVWTAFCRAVVRGAR